MSTTCKLPAGLADDLAAFDEQTRRFERGEISFAEYRAFRVPQGVYEQRDEGLHMLRVRLAAGLVLPEQMKTLARVSQRYGDGALHVTDRQDIQIHAVPLAHLHRALVELHAARLSTKGGGGNTVRNITACPLAGVCDKERFDVAPDAVALTEHLIDDPSSYRMPRKLKIAFSGCPDDCAAALVNDLGFIARSRNGQRGYAVYVGGGMGAHCRIGELLEPFVPADRIHHVAQAVKRVFDLQGNRRNRKKARLRHLIEDIGLEQFRDLYIAQRRELPSDDPAPAPRRLAPPGQPATPRHHHPGRGFESWLATNVLAQKQPGYHLVQIPLHCGNIAAQTLDRLAEVIADHGQQRAHATQSQNLSLRWVRDDELAAVHDKLAALELAEPVPPVLRQLVSCPGPATCKLGLCLSRGLAQAVTDELRANSLDLSALADVNIHISGCPNACGRHPIAAIGLYGAARRAHGRLAPHYVLQLGGRLGEQRTRLARGRHTIPARHVSAVITELLRAFRDSPQFPDFHAFVDVAGEALLASQAANHRHLPAFDVDPSLYHDLSSEKPFTLAGRGAGECGAGVFDLIELDLAHARGAAARQRYHAATVAAARALLVTRGLEARDDTDALRLFSERFLDDALMADHYRPLLEAARQAAITADPEHSFDADPSLCVAFVAAVQQLYDGLDASLRFRPIETPSTSDDLSAVHEDREAPDGKTGTRELDKD